MENKGRPLYRPQPCPCCGTNPRLVECYGIWDNSMMIECPSCGLRTAAASYYTPDTFPDLAARRLDMSRDAVAKKITLTWNMRAGAAAEDNEAASQATREAILRMMREDDAAQAEEARLKERRAALAEDEL